MACETDYVVSPVGLSERYHLVEDGQREFGLFHVGEVAALPECMQADARRQQVAMGKRDDAVLHAENDARRHAQPLQVLADGEGLRSVCEIAQREFVKRTGQPLIAALFLVQRYGTARVASLFGPITALWFIVMTIGGFMHIADDPGIFAALNPYHAVRYIWTNGHTGLVVIGAVFRSVTGAEALYADLGHFGRKPIQAAWLGFVFPALAANYLGQGALVLANPEALANPFFLLFPNGRCCRS